MNTQCVERERQRARGGVDWLCVLVRVGRALRRSLVRLLGFIGIEQTTAACLSDLL